MTASHTLGLSTLICLVGTALSGCGGGDTVLALNVTLRQSAQTARTLAVSIVQPGQSPLATTVTVKTKQTDAGVVPDKNEFYERITLPESFTDAVTTVTVTAKDETGVDVGTATDMVDVHAAEAVAGWVTLGEDPPPAAAAP